MSNRTPFASGLYADLIGRDFEVEKLLNGILSYTGNTGNSLLDSKEMETFSKHFKNLSHKILVNQFL